MSFLSNAFGAQNNFHAASATGDAKFKQQDLQPAINTAQTGFQNQIGQANNIVGQQGDLASQLRAQAAGQGPNIAAMQLQQATDRNNQQAAGMMASQRGLNPALAARLIAQNQATNNQQAAGQSGLMRAEQQLAAQGQLANVYGQQAGETLQGGALQNQNLGINQQAFQNQNADIINAQNAAQGINAGVQQQNAGINAGVIGGLISGGASALSMGGGGAKKAYEGGEIEESDVPEFLTGGAVPAKVSPGERYLKAREVHEINDHGGNPMKKGHMIPGKAKVEGDSPKNDTVKAELEPGGVVLPRSVTQAEDNSSRAREFMKAIKEDKEPGPKGFAKILEMKRKMKEMHGHLQDLHDMMKEA